MRDTVSNVAAMNAYAKKIPKSQYGNNTSFLVLQKIIMDDENEIFQIHDSKFKRIQRQV